MTHADAAWAWHVGQLLYVVLVPLGVFLRTRLVTAAGGLGLATYLIFLSNQVFKSSLFFPIILVSVGIAIIVVGVSLHKRRAAIDAWMDEKLPEAIKSWRPPAPQPS